jgi:large subunit ribosomal protein L24
MPAPISLPAMEGQPQLEVTPPPQVPVPGRDPRRPPAKQKAGPRASPAPAAVNGPSAPTPPVAASGQVAPLPPPIDVKPAPGAAKPRLRPPLSLTPQVANPPRPPQPLQNSN